MQDDSVNPDPEPDSDEGGAKVYASLSSLGIGGQPPEVGDEVELTVKGTVDSIDGDTACVTPTEVNGEPAPEDESADQEEPSERDKLYSQAQDSDAQF